VRILMLAQFYAPIIGGEERVVEELARGLADRGHEISVATLRQHGLPSLEVNDRVRVHRLPSTGGPLQWLSRDGDRRHAPPAPDPVTLLALRAVLARERPQIVHAHNWLGYAFVPLKRWSGARLVVSLHDCSLVCATKRFVNHAEACSGPGPRKCVACATAHYGVVRGAPIAAANWASGTAERRMVDLFLPVSQSVADQVLRQRGRVPHRVIPNFLRDGDGEAGGRADPRLQALPDRFVLFVGDALPDKGIDVALRAHALVDGAPPLVIIGREGATARASFSSNVLAVGPWPHDLVMEAWRRCLLALVPSLSPETFGLAALEAMAAGRPVIASRIGGLPELIRDGQEGVLVEPGDVSSLAAAIERLLADPELRARMGAAGRRRALDYTASSVVPRVEAAYRDVLASAADGAADRARRREVGRSIAASGADQWRP
jgi:glycosyltransferase involved in cell wall biosynthesis